MGPPSAMRVLTQAERAAVRTALGRQLRGPELHLFTQSIEWDACRLARELCEELLSLEPRIDLTVHDFQSERATARHLGVTGIPSILPIGANGGRVRFLGVPLGHQFAVLLDDIVDAASGTSRLSGPTLDRLHELSRPLHIRVFASADCPYSPRTVRLAHQLAFASPLVQAEMVSVVEFPELADRFGVASLPTVVVNDGVVQFEGALAESEFVAQVFRAAPARPAGAPTRTRPAAPNAGRPRDGPTPLKTTAAPGLPGPIANRTGSRMRTGGSTWPTVRRSGPSTSDMPASEREELARRTRISPPP